MLNHGFPIYKIRRLEYCKRYGSGGSDSIYVSVLRIKLRNAAENVSGTSKALHTLKRLLLRQKNPRMTFGLWPGCWDVLSRHCLPSTFILSIEIRKLNVFAHLNSWMYES